ncbi:MAG: hypothetical protein RSB99_02895 [Bacilli bacterium]
MKNRIEIYQSNDLVYISNSNNNLVGQVKKDNSSLENSISPIEPVITASNDIQVNTAVIETFTGIMSGYGPDCYGCTTGLTSSGYDIQQGNIYFQDADYGKIRIAAADKKYPFGSIIKISKSKASKETFYAIVLDRGSAIGLNKKRQLDLLYTSEEEANNFGLSKNVLFEIVRLGY